ncbi:MAG: sugar ABC transporter permease [Streptosporangiaceae bacterium]|nr:sugar ABC transporter permease [Streptosporangiaceae bacterium]MBV9857480.1 sugar ABC transporter permease [Streptosporangiaceae bacterium]
MLSTAKRAGAAPPPATPNGQWSQLPLPVRYLKNWVRRHRLAPYLLLLPSAVAIGLLLVWPAIQLGIYSFQDYGLPQVTGAAGTQWTGFGNFSTILSDPEFWSSLKLSVAFSAIVVPLTLVVGTLVGLLLNRLGRRMAAFVSTAALLAWATPAVSASVLFVWVFDPDGGLVDWVLRRLPGWLDGGAHWNGFSWTNAALPAYTVITLLVVWQSFPFIAVSVLAGLKTMPPELAESARVDGAGPWQIFWRITYPVLKPIFMVLLLLSVIWDFGVFTQVYVVIGGLGNRDEFNLGIYAYDHAFTMPPTYGLASALALILTVVLLIITVGYVRASVRQGAID